jgi:hypothetical protein
MRFRLIYEGPLHATQNDPSNGQRWPVKGVAQKHAIRQKFHAQLKELWSTNKFLAKAKRVPLRGPHRQMLMAEAMAHDFEINGFRFAPLVCERWDLQCSLDILFLRRDSASSVMSAGDLDNRIKTLIDTLRMPMNSSELAGMSPAADENPFFVLMENDNLVTRLSVETDRFFNGSTDLAQVSLVVTVDLRPAHTTFDNEDFA